MATDRSLASLLRALQDASNWQQDISRYLSIFDTDFTIILLLNSSDYWAQQRLCLLFYLTH